MPKIIFFILFTALISSLASWFSNNKGKVIIEWFGWSITTSPGFFLITLISSIFLLYFSISLIINLLYLPKNTLKFVKQKKIKKAKLALNNGIIASFYGNSTEVLKSLNIAKKYLTNSPLLILLEFQHSVYKNNNKTSFYLLTQMLDIDVLKPLAIKGLIAYAKKNKDRVLFKNVLDKSLDKKIDFKWLNEGVYSFCIENHNWKDLSDFLEKKISLKSKRNKEMLSAIYYQIATNYYFIKDKNNAILFLKKAISYKNFFPPYMELYFKLSIEKSEKGSIKKLKKYWNINPNPNIEKCINYSISDQDNLDKIRKISKILSKHDNCYYKFLILGKFKYYAKIWGSSKNDLNKSIKIMPSKEAYKYLYKIEKTYNNKIKSNQFEKLYQNCSEIYFWKCKACNILFENWVSYCNVCKSFDSIKMINNQNISYKISSNSLTLTNKLK
ncbi:MAG: hypothetical protein CMP36_00835 [Rickettsiales bacterium]|nr:hypothetical protein [Rickettsiales bacterium]OUV82956.1 MAG: hypothetical protein CBC91_01215 [Rickettsiales bacterium TMED131]